MKLTAIEPGIEAIVSSIRHIGLRHGDLQTIVPLAKSAVCSLTHIAPVFLNIPLMRVLDKLRPSLTSMTQTLDHACAASEDTTS